jgi:hypothetical protein
MRERPDSSETGAPDQFLVDGVAPPVIGEGPPEAATDDWDGGGRHDGADQYYESRRTEPPTSPIPVVHQLPPEQGQPKKKSWVAKVFGR